MSKKVEYGIWAFYEKARKLLETRQTLIPPLLQEHFKLQAFERGEQEFTIHQCYEHYLTPEQLRDVVEYSIAAAFKKLNDNPKSTWAIFDEDVIINTYFFRLFEKVDYIREEKAHKNTSRIEKKSPKEAEVKTDNIFFPKL